jgi:threonine dehydrogenase-like Zn-dependent dehydrogenase
MRQAIWTERGGIDVIDGEPPELPAGWVRLRVAACGICGSDIHSYEGGEGRVNGTAPGHEMTGTILDTAVGGLPDSVFAVSPNVTCGRCEYCLTGRTNLCRRGGPGIGLGRNGGLAEYVDAPAANLVPVHPDVPAPLASLAEPLAVAGRGIRLAEVAPDSAVLILGGGTIGLMVALLARDRAANVAVSARQRALAEAIGVEALSPDDAVAWGKQHRPDVVIETVGGAADTINEGVRAAARGGTLIVLGTFGTTSIDMLAAMLKEVRIIGSFAYGTGRRRPEFAAAVDLLPRYTRELPMLQTDTFALDDVDRAFACAMDKKTGSIKVTIVP